MSRTVVAGLPGEIIRFLEPNDAISPGTPGTVTFNRIGPAKPDGVCNVMMELLDPVAWISRINGEASRMKSGLLVVNIDTVAV